MRKRDIIEVCWHVAFLIGATIWFLRTPQIIEASTIIPGATATTDIIQTIQTTGLYRGKTAYTFNIMGRRAGFTSISVLNDVVEFANGTALIPVLTGVEPLEIVSSSANDTAASTGAQSVKVTYIDTTNNLVQSAAIPLNGATPVAAGFTAMEPLWMETSAVGSGTIAAGNIRLRVVSGAVECEQITAGGNRSLSARFMVPTGFTAYVSAWTQHAINNDQDMRLRANVDTFTRAFVPAYHFIDNQYLALNTNGVSAPPFLKLPALAKIKVSTISAGTAGTLRADTAFTITLLGN